MPAATTVLYPDSLLFEPLMGALKGAQWQIRIATYLFKTSYTQHTRANDILDALIAAPPRGVDVEVILSHSEYNPDVSYENYLTAQKLAAAGCKVRLGPPNETFHSKIALIDNSRLFAGSHNLTRGGLTYNFELSWCTDAKAVVRPTNVYFEDLWVNAIPLEKVAPPSPPREPIVISLTSVSADGAAVTLGFSVNHAEGVEAFAAVADTEHELAGARMGVSVPPTARSASVIPNAAAGSQIYVAVRAYRGGAAVATGNLLQMTYQPTAAPPADLGEPESDEASETPAPAAPPAPNLLSVVAASETTVTVTWAFPGMVNFSRFEIEQRDTAGNWRYLATLVNPTVRTWTGAPHSMNPALPMRVVVYNTAGEWAGSNEVGIA